MGQIRETSSALLVLGLGIETNFTIRFNFDYDSISIILDISYNKWPFFSRESILLNAVNYGSLVVAYRLH